MRIFFSLVSHAILFLAPVCCAFAQDVEARLLEFNGTVELRDPDSPDWRPAALGELIKKDTVISTGFKSAALIALGDSRLSVRPLTRLSLEELALREGSEEVSVYLRSGRVRAEVRPPAGGKTGFTVRSPVATASVRGTVFEFDSRRLRVDGGIVRLSNSRGQRVYVAEGQQSYIEESSRRPVPPFEAGNTLLSPALPELASTGSTGGLQAPDIPPPPADLGVSVTWP